MQFLLQICPKLANSRSIATAAACSTSRSNVHMAKSFRGVYADWMHRASAACFRMWPLNLSLGPIQPAARAEADESYRACFRLLRARSDWKAVESRRWTKVSRSRNRVVGALLGRRAQRRREALRVRLLASLARLRSGGCTSSPALRWFPQRQWSASDWSGNHTAGESAPRHGRGCRRTSAPSPGSRPEAAIATSTAHPW